MRTTSIAPASERDLSYQDFAADPLAQAIGLDVLAILDNQELARPVQLRYAEKLATVISLPRQVGRTACTGTEHSFHPAS